MKNLTPAPQAPSRPATAPSLPGVTLATGLGLGSVPRAPGTAGSLGSVALFALLFYGLPGALLQIAYLFVLVWLLPLALWSTEQALQRWKTPDPQVIVIDEIVGQWLTYAGLVLSAYLGGTSSFPVSAGWKYLLAGFILFRAFDVMKPFPIRRSERLPGAAGVVLDDLVAGGYAALGLLLLVRTGWLE